MYKLIIFDFDGPILDSLENSQKSVSRAVKKLTKNGVDPEKLKVSRETYIKCWGYPGLKTVKMMFPILAKNDFKIIIECWRKNELKEKIPLVKGAMKTLKLLKTRGYLTALLTSRSNNLEFHLEGCDLEKIFNIIQTWKGPRAECKKLHSNHIFCSKHKPNPNVLTPILKWAKNKGVSKKEIVMIDDTLVGLGAAQSRGIDFLGVLTGPLNSKVKWQRYGNLRRKYVINSIADLPRWLREKDGGMAQLV